MRAHTKETQATMTPAKALQYLREGNERFRQNLKASRDLLRQVNETRDGQFPFATVLSCIDSRTSAELIFDQGLGDVFSVRVAGPVINDDVLGSMEFATKIAGSKLVVVLGHTRCGAVKATCDFVSKGVDAAQATGLTNLPSITAPIAEAVAMETLTRERRDGSNYEFVDRVAALNVRHQIRWIEANSPVLRSMILNGEVAIVGAMYDVASGRVAFLDGAGDAPAPMREAGVAAAGV